MKRIVLLLFVFAFLRGRAQDRYAYLPEGKTTFKTSYKKIFVKYGGDRRANFGRFATDSSFLRSPTIGGRQLAFKQDFQNKDSLNTVLTQLRKDANVEYATPFLETKSGALIGLTNQVIVRLKRLTAYPAAVAKFNNWTVQKIRKNQYTDREYILTIDGKGEKDALDIANGLYETGLFEYSEPDFLYTNVSSVGDPYYAQQWGLHNTGQYNGTAGDDINVESAWTVTTGSGIKVAVLDEGVDLVHPDLTANLLTGYDAVGLGSAGAPSGDEAHGTACSGIIGAVGYNDIGVRGVAYSSKIIPVRMIQGNVTTSSIIADAFNWAYTTANADVISCSWRLFITSSTVNTAISNALAWGRGLKGCVVLFASGNSDSTSISYPANVSGVIAVGGSNPCDQRISFNASTATTSCNYDTRQGLLPAGSTVYWGSNRGTGLGVVAPGINIATTDISGAAGYSNIAAAQGFSIPDQNYLLNFDGTSSATPFAAGVVALILSANSGLTSGQATSVLETTASKVGGYTYGTTLTNGTWNSEMGYGRVNACAAVAGALGNLTITGPTNFCTSGSYSIVGLGPAVAATWTWTTTSGSPTVTVTTTSSNACSIAATGSGKGILTATIAGSCGVTLSATVYIGTPQNSLLVPYGPTTVYQGSAGEFAVRYDGVKICGTGSVYNPIGATSFTWAWSGTATGASGGGACSPSTPTNAGYQITWTSTGTPYYTVKATNACGTSTTSTPKYVTIDDSRPAFIISPNPAVGSVTILSADDPASGGGSVFSATASQSGSEQKITRTISAITQVNVYDQTGTLRQKNRFSGLSKKESINVAALPTGVYYVEVITSTGKERHPLLVTH